MSGIVIIGANEYQNKLILKAESLGYTTHVFAWEHGAVGKKNASFFYPISVMEKEAILEECLRIKPEGVCSVASDLCNITAGYLTEKLGLCGNTPEAVKRSTNKALMRAAFAKAGIPSPCSTKVKASDSEAEIIGRISQMQYPLIIKPTDRSGSRGVRKVERIEDVIPAVQAAISAGFENAAMIEEYVEGAEYSVEYISWRGRHKFMALTEKFTTGAPSFIETGHLQPAAVSSGMLYKVKTLTEKALDSLGIEYGASHSELKISNEGDIKFIEIGSRMGGDCIGSDLTALSTGDDYLGMVIDTAVGREPHFNVSASGCPCGIRFIFSRDDVDRMKKIPRDHIVETFFNEDFDGNVSDSSSRGGYFIVKGDTAPEVKKYLYGEL